jgi:tetratricopeptide (TPR) repeat protein
MFTIRLRLGYLLRQTDPAQAISLFQEVLQIDPLRLEINEMIGDVYKQEAENTTDPTQQQADYQNAINFYNAELALSPVTPAVTALTGDTANNAHVHWDLAEIYAALGNTTSEKTELQAYLDATKWHSDTYPWRIALAQARIVKLAERK